MLFLQIFFMALIKNKERHFHEILYIFTYNFNIKLLTAFLKTHYYFLVFRKNILLLAK